MAHPIQCGSRADAEPRIAGGFDDHRFLVDGLAEAEQIRRALRSWLHARLEGRTPERMTLAKFLAYAAFYAEFKDACSEDRALELVIPKPLGPAAGAGKRFGDLSGSEIQALSRLNVEFEEFERVRSLALAARIKREE